MKKPGPSKSPPSGRWSAAAAGSWRSAPVAGSWESSWRTR